MRHLLPLSPWGEGAEQSEAGEGKDSRFTGRAGLSLGLPLTPALSPRGEGVRWLHVSSSILLTFAIASCTVGPDYKEPPKVEAPSAYHEATTQPARPTTQPAAPTFARWWTVFHDEKLDHLIEEAVRSNIDLQVAEARVREARAQRLVAKAELLPQVNADGSYTRSRSSEHVIPNGSSGFITPGAEEDLFQAGFDASWEIDVFGGIRRNVEAATADVEAAVEDRRDVLVTLLSEVARNYADLRGDQRRLAIAWDNIHSQEDVVRLTESRYQAGVVSELDVAQAKALLATTRAEVPPLEASVQQSIHQLGVQLGREPGALQSQLETPGPIPPAPPEVPVGLPSDLLRRRPDIRRAERQLAAATARVGVAVADLFPKFSLTGTAGLESISTSDFFNWGSRYWTIGPTMTWPLFAGGRIHANIEVQNAREEQAKGAYELAVLTSLKEVEDALVNYSREQVRRQSLADAVAANQRAVDLSSELYTRGLTPFINVLDAQASLHRSQDDLAQSERTVSTDLVAVYKALGGGWE